MQTARTQNIFLHLTRHNDLALAILLVAIISLIIFPLPTIMMDGLIAVNLCLAVSLLMVSLYISSSIALSTFPTLLLLTTLFRLSLNIATTRLILINADAGQIIHTFGNFVVAGNFVVGAIVFLIISIVQFVVIAKGSERVAEVSARFTLDALPGKQMSIDADVRAGNIDMDEAIKRRTDIQTESSLYGAMDGAMKFVKGDAIAGLIITIINILAGIAIGVLQKGMPAVDALQTYSLLTIGDGLISQIPALFISITSGIIVTRSNNGEKMNLGNQISRQMLSQPKGLAVSGVIIGGFALVPGFPKLIFLFIGFCLFMTGFTLLRKTKQETQDKTESDPLERVMSPFAPRIKKVKQDGEFTPTVPLQIDMDAGIKATIEPVDFNKELLQIRRALYMELGLPFPDMHLNESQNLPSGRYTLLVNEIPVANGDIKPGHLFTLESTSNLNMLGIAFEEGKSFLPGHPTLWVPEQQRSMLEAAEISYMTPTRMLAYHISMVLKHHAKEFIGIQETKSLLEKMANNYPDLVEELEKLLSVPQITDMLQRLVQEGISIRDLKAIFECMVEWGQKEQDVVVLTEYVRTSLKRYISYRYSGGQNMLSAYMLDPRVEETIRQAIRQNNGTSYLALDPNQTRQILDAVKANVGDAAQHQTPPVLLTAMDVRRYVKKLVETENRFLPVLSYQELTSDITIQPLGRICLLENAQN